MFDPSSTLLARLAGYQGWGVMASRKAIGDQSNNSSW